MLFIRYSRQPVSVRTSARYVEAMKHVLGYCWEVRLRYAVARQLQFVDMQEDILSDDHTAAFLRDPIPTPLHTRTSSASAAFKH